MIRQMTRKLSSSIPYDRISIAPMLNVTNELVFLRMLVTHSYQRYFVRLLSKHTTLYTEMFVDDYLIHHKNVDRLLQYKMNHSSYLDLINRNIQLLHN